MRISLFPGVNTNFLRFKTLCGPDDQFSSPKQIRWSAALGRLLVADSSNNRTQLRNFNLTFSSKYTVGAAAHVAVDADANYIYQCTSYLRKIDPVTYATIGTPLLLSHTRMIDASGDPDHVYVTCNATAFHGVKKIRKSDMTEVASIGGAAGSGDGQFNNPLGVKYYGGFVYVCDVDNKRIVKLNASGAGLTFDSVVYTHASYSPGDLDFDGTNWYVILFGGQIKKLDSNFTALIPDQKVDIVCYSLCIIPDQGDGNGQTIAITDNANSHLARYKCSDLTQVGSDVGSSGTGADTLCDPQVTGPAGIWYDSEGGSYAVASGANISKNGFSGDFFRATPNMLIYRPTGVLAAITAIDFSSDNILGEIVNLYRCRSLASVKLQSNPYIALNFGCLPSCVTTLWAYACSASVFGPIKHMVGLSSLNVRENGYSQSQVDQLIDEIWQLRETHAVCTININGSNAAPSGTYQTAETPSTGKEKVYDLINNYGYDITYTA